MALIKKCNICGKTEGKVVLSDNDKRAVVKFSNLPLKLQIPNFDGQLYNIIVDVKCEKASDTDKITSMQKEYAALNYTDFLQKVMSLPKENIVSNGNSVGVQVKLDEPYPMICDVCKTGLMKLAIQHGSFFEYAKF